MERRLSVNSELVAILLQRSKVKMAISSPTWDLKIDGKMILNTDLGHPQESICQIRMLPYIETVKRHCFSRTIS
jgi:hypothetical protein